MTATGPVFDPARSAALRDILHETVAAAAPSRPSRARFAVLTGLIAAALLLAGGTAALALSGVLHFGAPEPAPAPLPASPTVTPTPTPTPTAAAPRVLVTNGIVLPHDVDAAPSGSRWSLTLPGIDDGCRMPPQEYDLNDGLSVFLSGTRPKEYEGGPCTEGSHDERIGLTLVDTTNGTILWQRTWAYTADPTHGNQGTRFQLLGTSGRAMLTTADDVQGAHDVIDLATGTTVGTFDPAVISWADPVPGSSGDLLVTPVPGDTRSQQGETISRIDPRDPSHPKWTTAIEGYGVSVGPGTHDPQVLPLFYWVDDKTRAFATVDLESGAVSKQPDLTDFSNSFETVTVWFSTAPDGTRMQVALDGAGRRLWSRPLTPGSYDVAVFRPGTRPGARFRTAPGTDTIAVVSRTSVTLVDQVTGDDLWTTSLAGCDPVDFLGLPSAYLDSARGAVTVSFAQDRSCSFDRATGRLLSPTSIPYDFWSVLGQRNVYVDPWDTQSGTAYDAATGKTLWTIERHEGERWTFAGGYLIGAFGNTIRSIG